MTREEKLEKALKAAMASLGTYGSHPIIEKQANSALKQVKNCSIPDVSNSALDVDKGHGICKEEGCEKFAVIDYNQHGHWNCQYHYDKNTRYFEANFD